MQRVAEKGKARKKNEKKKKNTRAKKFVKLSLAQEEEESLP